MKPVNYDKPTRSWSFLHDYIVITTETPRTSKRICQVHLDVTFTLSPSPLHSPCNLYVSADVQNFKGSCELAKPGLAVWHAAPGKFAEVSDIGGLDEVLAKLK